MVRYLFRTLRQGMAGLILLALTLCAVEVGIRVRDAVRPSRKNETTPLCAAPWCKISQASERTFLELKPLTAMRVRSQETGEPVTIRINSFGLRGDEPAVPKPRDVFRILWLGDESLLAGEAKDSETLPGLLQAHLQATSRTRIEVINGGLPGGCPLTEYLLFRDHGMALQPDAILMQFHLSDVTEHRHLQRHSKLDAKGCPLACVHPLANWRTAEPTSKRLCEQLRLLDVGSREVGRLWKQQSTSEEAVHPWQWLHEKNADALVAALQPLQNALQLAENFRIPVVLVMEPECWEVSPSAAVRGKVRAGLAADFHFPGEGPGAVVAEFVRKAGLPCCSISDGFPRGPQADRLFLKESPNLSLEGRQLGTEIVATFLTQQIRGPWNESSNVEPRR